MKCVTCGKSLTHEDGFHHIGIGPLHLNLDCLKPGLDAYKPGDASPTSSENWTTWLFSERRKHNEATGERLYTGEGSK